MNLLFECNSVFMQEHEYKEFELETLTNLLGTMRLEINEANSTGIDRMSQIPELTFIELLKINEATIAVNGLEIIVKELSKVPKYNEVIKENWVTTVEDIKEETPDSWIKWELRSHSEKGILLFYHILSFPNRSSFL